MLCQDIIKRLINLENRNVLPSPYTIYRLSHSGMRNTFAIVFGQEEDEEDIVIILKATLTLKKEQAMLLLGALLPAVLEQKLQLNYKPKDDVYDLLRQTLDILLIASN